MEHTPIKRLVSKRDIGIEAFELEGGDLLLEASLLDPYHLIRLTMRIDPRTKTIVDAESEFANHPHTICSDIAGKAARMVGLKVERGIARAVALIIGGCDGCVHLKELALEAINFAATALIGYEEGFGLMSRAFNVLEEEKRLEITRVLLKDSCHVYKATDL